MSRTTRTYPQKPPTPRSRRAWEPINERRCDLIEKNVANTITAEEVVELAQLQEVADDFIAFMSPNVLDKLREFAKEHGLNIEEIDGPQGREEKP